MGVRGQIGSPPQPATLDRVAQPSRRGTWMRELLIRLEWSRCLWLSLYITRSIRPLSCVPCLPPALPALTS
jgi:uncharacterized membrane-anchored protein